MAGERSGEISTAPGWIDNEFDRTQLWWYCITGQEDMVETSIKTTTAQIDQKGKAFIDIPKSSDSEKQVIRAVVVETPCEAYVTPLWLACCEGYPKIVKALIDAGADPLCRGFSWEMDCLSVAAYNGHDEVVRLLACNVDCLNTADKFGQTAMHAASYNGHHNILKMLIEKGAGLETANKGGITGLWMASWRGQTEAVRALIEGGANVHTVDQDGISPLHIAAGLGFMEIVDLLINEFADVNWVTPKGIGPLYIAAAGGFTEAIERLLSAGAELETKDMRGETPLYVAVDNGETDAVKTLIKAGADLTVISDGCSLLHTAAYCGNTEVCKLLIEASEGKMSRDEMQVDASFVMSAYTGYKDIVEFFIDYGVDLETKHAGRTALFEASYRGHADIVKALIDAKAKVNTVCTESTGNTVTAGEAAMTHGHMDVVDLLVRAGWDISKEPDVLLKAVSGNHEELIRHLFASGKDMSTWDFPGMFAAATFKGHTGLIQILFKTGMKICPKKMLQPRVYSELSYEAYRMVMVTLHKFITNQEILKRITPPFSDIIDILYITIYLVYQDLYQNMPQHIKPPFSDIIDYDKIFTGFTVRECKLSEVPDILGLCQVDLGDVIKTPGLGNVTSLPGNRACEVFDFVGEQMSIMTERINRTRDPPVFNVTLRKCGSAEEGTSVGLPDEADFLFESKLELNREVFLRNVEDGYVHLEKNQNLKIKKVHMTLNGERFDLFCNGSKHYHDEFWQKLEVSDAFDHIEDLNMLTMTKDGGHASTPISVPWKESKTSRHFSVSVDLVPVIHFPNIMITQQRTSTWLMEEKDFIKAGFSIVAKPPHKKSPLGKRLAETDRVKLWRLSFSHLETVHLVSLDPEVKAAYVAAKCLRNPDVCRVFLKDNGVLRTVDCYINSYMLKTVFLHKVEDFLKNRKSLLHMVSILYTDLESALSKRFLPMFWLPHYNVLAGLRHDIEMSHKVAMLMTSLLGKIHNREGPEMKPRKIESPPTGYFAFDLES